MPRPPIDLHQKVRDLLRHTDSLPAELSSPIVNYERTVDGYLFEARQELSRPEIELIITLPERGA